jgi:excisionase family DNA binding protein
MAKALEALAGLRKRDLHRFLESDKRVRAWLGEQLLGTKQAAEVLGVERSRIWRWEQQGKIEAVRDAGATKLYLRSDLERLLADDPPQTRRRRNGDSP